MKSYFKSAEYSEKVMYRSNDFPIKAWLSVSKHFPGLSDIMHWHNDFEILRIKSGNMYYNIEGDIIHLEKGNILFINSEHMHYGFQKIKSDCEIEIIMFHPTLIISPSVEKNLGILFDKNSSSYLLFSDTNSDALISYLYVNTYKLIVSGNASEIEILGSIYLLMGNIIKHLKVTESKILFGEKELAAMRKMTGYVQKNHSNRITINEIAKAGMVCRSKCCEMFRKYMNKSPNNYLNDYRIAKSIELLRNSKMSITDISSLCGFSSSSYFTEMFSQKLDMTPSEYRRKYGE